jgi:DNA mismatch repair protein MutS
MSLEAFSFALGRPREVRHMFRSVLFDGQARDGRPADPEVVRDLNLDQVIRAAIDRGDGEFLRPIYLTPLVEADAVRYRQLISADLEDPQVRQLVAVFGEQMARVRSLLGGDERTHRYQRLRWMLDAAQRYGQAVRQLADGLGGLPLRSAGLTGFREHLAAHAASAPFRRLRDDASACLAALEAVRYNVRIEGLRVRVLPFRDEADYGTEIEETFARFGRGETRTREFTFPAPYMTRVDEQIVDRVARLNPEVFRQLERFGEAHKGFVDETIGRFGREVVFYIGYLDVIEPLRQAGLPFCYPGLASDGDVRATEAFDLALALKLHADGKRPVGNGFGLSGSERILVVTGPNQGGKTTFARMFGQLHHLACLGLPVPGGSADLRLFDRIFTHFDRQERAEDLTGKLEDDLLRLREITERATSRSLVILNESLSSTTLDDSLAISKDVLGALTERRSIGVVVTFLDELSRLDAATVSMVAEIDPSDPTRRTHRILRRPSDGLAYAAALAAKYGVTYAAVRTKVSA